MISFSQQFKAGYNTPFDLKAQLSKPKFMCRLINLFLSNFYRVIIGNYLFTHDNFRLLFMVHFCVGRTSYDLFGPVPGILTESVFE